VTVCLYSCLSYAASKSHFPPCHVVLSPVACLPLPYLSTLSHKRHDFRKKILSIKCVFWFSLQLLPETFLILRRIQRVIINVRMSSCKLTVTLVGFSSNLNFLDRFSRNSQISNLIKIRPVGTDLFQAVRQTRRS
jgi:hypothetical protein